MNKTPLPVQNSTIIALLSLLLWLSPTSHSESKFSPDVQRTIASSPPDQPLAFWIFFRDKVKPTVRVVSDHSLARRSKLPGPLIDERDYPVNQQYIDEVTPLVLTIRQKSRWFNAVSVLATPSQLPSIGNLASVETIGLLVRFRREEEPPPAQAPASPPGKSASGIDYGPSLTQLAMINVPPIHRTGNSGQGILIGVFDNGFRLLSHETFATLHIVGTYDFVDHKVDVDPSNPSSAFGSHGILTLSNIGAYTPGALVGPAFGADYLLARTENDSSETPVEEDNWIAAMEWADSLGVDVTSTSLGYLAFDAPYVSYSWEDMDGATTMISKAATIAAAKGIAIVNSAGNNGFNGTHNTLNAPADAEGVLTVGAANAAGIRSSFSSVGPTTDNPPRIKPDVMALGEGVVCASPTNPTAYTTSQGTSHACPLVAGVIALLLHAVPSAAPADIFGALRATASRSSIPDNQYGWGIVNATAALAALGGGTIPSVDQLGLAYPNPYNPSSGTGITLEYSVSIPSRITLTVYDILGRRIRTVVNSSAEVSLQSVVWDGKNENGLQVANGVYFYVLRANAVAGPESITAAHKLIIVR